MLWCKPEERRLFLSGSGGPKLASKQVGTGKKQRAQPLHHGNGFYRFLSNKDAISRLRVLCGLARKKSE